ncbi:MAG: dipeptide/oligopeptide/nickel ABC transporter permease [bacterium P3]|nr:MAG: dipeptide/oligopeptide/nickel ABC transporter permease [bacterium P3]KWW42108.1 MAG: dipeptide/oligopeptide/nickel ABC transporter permease [bacterium F083]
MLTYSLKRLLYGLLVLLGVVVFVFFLFNVLPGDPARMMLGQQADEESIAIINRDLGRDKPLAVQFLSYLNDLSPLSFHNNSDVSHHFYLDPEKYGPVLHLFSCGHTIVVFKWPYLRRSYQSRRPVSDIISSAFPQTAVLALTAMAFALLAGIVLGVLSAVYRDTWIDRLSLLLSTLGMSLPSFFAAILIAWLFAYLLADWTHLNMFGNLYAVDDYGTGRHLALKNLILPAFTLGIRPLATLSQLTKNSLLDALSQDYVRTARAKGLSYRRVVVHHALRNALNPVITSASGWLASLLAGAVFVEYVFDWKGMGVVIVDGLEKYDFPVVMGTILFICVLLVLINIITDILYAWLDPRVRLQ